MSDRFAANDALGSHLDDFAGDYESAELLRQGKLDGSLIRAKARALYEEFGQPEMARALLNPETPLSQKMDILKHIAEIADLKPKQAQIAATGTGLHVTINLPAGFTPPGAPAPASQQILDITPMAVDPLLTPEPEPPEPPPVFKVPDFKTARDIFGPPEPRPTART